MEYRQPQTGNIAALRVLHMGSTVTHMENSTPDYSAAVATTVARRIEDAGRSIKSVSDATGIAYTTITRRIASDGNSPFSVRELQLIADALGCRVVDLLPEVQAA